MKVEYKVKRYNPESDVALESFDTYVVELDQAATVLDGLIKIREEVDNTLTLRCSCRSAICGSCAMRINGQAMLACNTKVSDFEENGNIKLLVEPPGNMPVIKDLVVDFVPFWSKVKSVDPWLKSSHPPKYMEEHIASNESMLHLSGVMGCIMCGACVSDCTVLEVDKSFLGPAALAKAYRFVSDPRDDSTKFRLKAVEKPSGMWDCTRCMQCVEVCPKGVDPMGRIMKLRDFAIQDGYKNTYGAKHTAVFTDSVKNTGWLNEFQLPLRTFGIFNVFKLLGLLPILLDALVSRKVPPVFHHKLPSVSSIQRIFKKVDLQITKRE